MEARPDADPRQRADAGAAIVRDIKDGIGVSAEVEVVDPYTLERSVGKIQRIADLRSEGGS
ncbi:hypothetical protein GCM10020229_28930 [Kitasatospora albolonga]